MAYTPKKTKLQINYKVAIPFLILLFLVAYFFVNVLRPTSEENQKMFQVCDFNNEKTKKMLEKQYADTYEFQDYLYYGDSLALFTQPYDGSLTDDMSGKSIILKNICTKKEFAFVLDTGLDLKIMLNRIDTGFYELYIVENLKEMRLVSTTEIDELFMTSRNASNDNNIEVQFIANKEILKDYDVQLPANYAFLDVHEAKQAEHEYDVIIDPGGNNNDFTTSVSKGSEGFGMVEADESMQAAEKLKAQLDAKGLRTLIVRSGDEIINTYGEDGRLAKGYKAKGKYYIRLGFNESTDPALSGTDIRYSAHASKVLSKQIMYDFTKDTELVGSTVFMSASDEPGVIQSRILAGKLDGREVYDDDLYIREAGGRATQAGLFSQDSVNGTGSFSAGKQEGMYALNISFGYLTNEKDAKNWQNNKDGIVNSLAQSLITYIGVE